VVFVSFPILVRGACRWSATKATDCGRVPDALGGPAQGVAILALVLGVPAAPPLLGAIALGTAVEASERLRRR